MRNTSLYVVRQFLSPRPSAALAAHLAPRPHEGRNLAPVTALLLVVYGAYLLAYWPGILGEDSYAILREVDTQREQQSGKPIFWYLFVKLFYEPWHLVEVPIGVQMGIAAVLQGRILSWLWTHDMRKSFFFCLVFVSLSPHLMFMVGSLYSDGIFAVSMAALLFELWLAARTRRFGALSMWVVFLAMPFAVFSRPNGIANLVPVLCILLVLPWRSRWMLLAVTLFWSGLAGYGASKHEYQRPIGTAFPLALHETVNFMQRHPMYYFVETRPVTRATEEVLAAHSPLELIQQYYDRDYWDPLVFFPGGPDFLAMSAENKAIITREFYRHNLWNNFPAFMSSRVNIFLVAALGKGLFPHPDYTEAVIGKTKAESEYRKFKLDGFRHFVMSLQVAQYHWRWLLWTPFIGIALALWLVARGWRHRDLATTAIAGIYVVQLGAIFIFSIAGEYRYLLCFFTAPLVLLPLANIARQDRARPT
jgi:hypothetical protein